MDPVGTKFYQATFELEHDGKELQLRGLFSEKGITKIVISGGLPAYWRGRLGKSVVVKVDKMQMAGTLLEQHNEAGAFFEVRFRDPSEAHRKYISQRILTDGIHPGWKREFPRITVRKLADPEVAVPNLCMVRFQGQEVLVSVKDFTLRGMRIETLGDELKALKTGAEFEFDLMTSTGLTLSNLRAEIRNSTSHDTAVEGRTVSTHSFGIRFKEMSADNDQKYRRLIRDYLLALQRRVSSP